MEPKFSRELGDLVSHSCFFVNPLEEQNLLKEFRKYNNEMELPEHLKEKLKTARKRRKESKNVLSNTFENSAFMINDIINKILKERGEI